MRARIEFPDAPVSWPPQRTGAVRRRGRRERRRDQRKERLVAVVVALVAAGVSALAVTRVIDSGVIGDFAAHLRYARRLAHDLDLPFGHFLFPLLAGVLGEALGSYRAAAIVIGSMAQGALAAAIVVWFRSRLATIGDVARWASHGWAPAAATLMVLVAGPVSVALADGLRGHYFGYVALSTYHNPTQLLLRPFAVLLFLAVVQVLGARSRNRPPSIAFLGALVVLTTLAKPSYTVCVVPAALLMTWLDRGVNRDFDRRALLLGVVAPAVFAVAVTYVITFVTGAETLESASDGIVFAPFDVVSFYSDQLLAKFALSLLFPIAVLGCYPGALSKDIALRLAWICFAIGAFAMYFLAESGARRYQANFFWSAQVTLFIVYAASMAHVLVAEAKRRDATGRWRPRINTAVCAGAFTLSIVSGLEFLLATVVKPHDLLT